MSLKNTFYQDSKSLYSAQRLLFPLTFLLFLSVCFSSCTVSKQPFNPHKKYSAAQLQQDYKLFQGILETRHPSLYWYTSKPAMDSAFSAGWQMLNDSLTEYEFRKILSLAVARVECGHTSVRVSKHYEKYSDTVKGKTTFPFSVKAWDDSVAFISSIYKNISIRQGDIIDSINGRSVKYLLDTMYRFMPADGGSLVAKNQLLSSGTYFGSLYTALYGWQKQFDISYTDTAGEKKQVVLKPLPVKADSLSAKEKKSIAKKEKISKAERLKNARQLEVNTDSGYAIMQLNSFSEKLQLKKFFRQSFSELKKKQVNNLIIDLRLNGGGRVDNANYLIRRLTDRKYKAGDSLYATAVKSKYNPYIHNGFWINFFIRANTSNKNGRRHFRYFERHFFKPKKHNHFNGQVYLLSGGRSYSASTMVLGILKGQPHVTIVGEPSGGAAYGNSAWQIPVATLPQTKVRLRFPLFRYVINKNLPHDGQGVQPDVYAGTNLEAIRMGKDYKMEQVTELIKSKR